MSFGRSAQVRGEGLGCLSVVTRVEVVRLTRWEGGLNRPAVEVWAARNGSAVEVSGRYVAGCSWAVFVVSLSFWRTDGRGEIPEAVPVAVRLDNELVLSWIEWGLGCDVARFCLVVGAGGVI